MTADAAFARFAREIAVPDESLDLGRAALLLALMGDPSLDVDYWLDRLDRLADAASGPVAAALDGRKRVQALVNSLCVDYGLRGDPDADYDPRNSYIDQVLERRQGIPISLAVVLLEVGRRVGVELEGIGFPTHFLVKAGRLDDVYVDAFNEGRLLCAADCVKHLLPHLADDVDTLGPKLLRPVSKREILARMLRNLKRVFLRRRDIPRAIGAIDRLLLLTDDQVPEFRDRGLLFRSAGVHARAAADLQYYLAYAGPAPDREAVQGALEDSHRLLGLYN